MMPIVRLLVMHTIFDAGRIYEMQTLQVSLFSFLCRLQVLTFAFDDIFYY